MKNRYLVIAIILFAMIGGLSSIARVLPVNEELESQEDFILQNIDLPDLPGASVYVLQENEILPFKFLPNSSVKVKYEVYTYSNMLLTLIPELTVINTNVEQKVNSVKN
jgi:hypothetical protein